MDGPFPHWRKMTSLIVSLIALLLVIGAVTGCGSSSSSSASGGDGGSGKSCPDLGAIFSVNADAGYFASTDHDYKQAADAAVANDKEGFALLAAAGVIFPLDPGTKLRVTDVGFSSTQFRVLSGSSHVYETVRGDCSWVH